MMVDLEELTELIELDARSNGFKNMTALRFGLHKRDGSNLLQFSAGKSGSIYEKMGAGLKSAMLKGQGNN